MKTDTGVLYIEPTEPASREPVIDELTRRMTAAYRRSTPGRPYRGSHTCGCGARSDNCEHALPGSELTNSLCIHYLAFHRDEVSPAQLAKVARLQCGEKEPSAEELQKPALPRVRRREQVFRG